MKRKYRIDSDLQKERHKMKKLKELCFLLGEAMLFVCSGNQKESLAGWVLELQSSGEANALPNSQNSWGQKYISERWKVG